MPNKENIEPHKFKQGQSGNPAGRPKGTLNSKTILKRFLELTEEIENPVTGEKEKMTQLEILYLRQIAKARKGDLSALKEILDRYEGKAQQIVEQNINLDPRKDILTRYGLGINDDNRQTEDT